MIYLKKIDLAQNDLSKKSNLSVCVKLLNSDIYKNRL